MTDPRYASLFEPVPIGPKTAPNRFWCAPHSSGHGWQEANGSIAYRAMKAEGGWGTVIHAITEIAPDSDMGNHMIERLWDDADIPRHAAIAEAIQSHGALAGVELAHGGMRARNYHSGLPVPGPTERRILRPEVPMHSRPMDLADIRAFRTTHKAAARRAKQAGYDILYVYAAHDLSLLSHFLHPRYNDRSDEYGGSLENRMRLLREVLEDTLEIAAGRCAVVLRFSVAEPDRPDGLTADGEGRDVVEALAEMPDAWDVNLAGWPADSQTARFSDEGYQLPFTDFVKTVTSKPVIGVGRFTSADLMASVVTRERLDFIGGARAAIADPFLPKKIRDNRMEEIRECIGCNICVSMDSYGVPLRCTQNPTTAEEFRRNWHPENVTISTRKKSVLIIGSGPAGLECGLTLMRAGNAVTIADKSTEPGGRVAHEASLPGLSSWRRVLDYRLDPLQQSADISLFQNSQLTGRDLVDFGADHVVVATGARWRSDVGASGPVEFPPAARLLTPDAILAGAEVTGAVTVYDDDHFYMGSAIAEKLARSGCAVTYATPQAVVSYWTDHTLEQSRIEARLKALGVRLLVNTRLTSDGLKNVLNEHFDDAGETIVLVGARASDHALHEEAQGVVPADRLWLCGDALVPGAIHQAIHSGHRTARLILGDPLAGHTMRREVPQLLI